MGSFLSGILGTDSQYQATPAQAGNPYSQAVLQDELNKQAQIYQGQQGLAQALQQQMAGVGPNPAQTQYQQNVNQNTAQAQGLIASQRGLNPALAAKMGANAGALANQQAASQSSLLQQQQQLGATQNLGNLYGQMQQGNIAHQGLYTGSNQGAMQTNAGVASGNQQQASKIVGGIFSGAGSAATAMAAHGGMIEDYADGGQINSGENVDYSSITNPQTSKGPVSAAGKFLSGQQVDYANMSNPQMTAQGGVINFKPGGPVPGKASVNGNSLKNDTVPAMVSPGEIVLPRSVTQAKDAPQKAAAFVSAVLTQNKMRKKK